jgi:hypothetical protein
MRLEQVEVYKLAELLPESQEKAHGDYLNSGDSYFWNDENVETLKAFEKEFPVKVGDWEYGNRNYINFHLTCDSDIKNLAGNRLYKFIVNTYWNVIYSRKVYYHKDKKRISRIFWQSDCNLTGYHLDNYILQPLIDYLKRPEKNETLENLMNDCLHEWIFACRKDYEFSQSFENFKETSEANNWEYTEDGKMY